MTYIKHEFSGKDTFRNRYSLMHGRDRTGNLEWREAKKGSTRYNLISVRFKIVQCFSAWFQCPFYPNAFFITPRSPWTSLFCGQASPYCCFSGTGVIVREKFPDTSICTTQILSGHLKPKPLIIRNATEGAQTWGDVVYQILSYFLLELAKRGGNSFLVNAKLNLPRS